MHDSTYYKQLLEYRITKSRREVLERESRKAQAGADAARDRMMAGDSSTENVNSMLTNLTRRTRINAIYQKGLPIERRSGVFAGKSNDLLKNVMAITRASEKKWNPNSA